jgi:hypothetical protein
MRWIVRALSVGIVVLACGVIASSGTATAGSATPSAATIQLRFRQIPGYADGHCGNALITVGDYALISLAPKPTESCASYFLLINEQTGRRVTIHGSGFEYVLAFGPPWILFFHNLRFQIYNIDTGKSRPLDCTGACMPSSTIGYALGALWLELFVQQQGSCGDGVHYDCGPVTQSFYNLVTHKFRSRQTTTSRTILDLDSPSLLRRVCSPLRVPATGTLSIFGTFAVETQPSGSLLERCGSHLQIPIGVGNEGVGGGGMLASGDAVLWNLPTPSGSLSGQLTGILLPSLRRISIALPGTTRRLIGASSMGESEAVGGSSQLIGGPFSRRRQSGSYGRRCCS